MSRQERRRQRELEHQRESEKRARFKVIDLELAQDEVEDLRHEVEVLSLCSSPHVIKYHGSYVAARQLWIVMEYAAGGCLLDVVQKAPLSEGHIQAVLRQVLLGISYLHNNNMIHRDIKAANSAHPHSNSSIVGN